MWVLPGLCRAQADVREAATQPGVTVRFIYAKAENLVVSAALFVGWSGHFTRDIARWLKRVQADGAE